MSTEGFKVILKGTDSLHSAGPPAAQGQKPRPYTQEEAEARCKQANADASKLGIETRYEVVAS